MPWPKPRHTEPTKLRTEFARRRRYFR